MADLQGRGLRVLLLSGDRPEAVAHVAREVGIAEAAGGLSPQDKLERLRELQRQGAVVAMVGDGVNDAPALAAATVGIAMGGAGTAVALETADVALMGDDLCKLPFAVALSRASAKIIKQNLGIALSVIVLLIIASAFGAIPLSVAVVFHEGSTLVVVLNGLRLLVWKEPVGDGGACCP